MDAQEIRNHLEGSWLFVTTAALNRLSEELAGNTRNQGRVANARNPP